MRILKIISGKRGRLTEEVVVVLRSRRVCNGRGLGKIGLLVVQRSADAAHTA